MRITKRMELAKLIMLVSTIICLCFDFPFAYVEEKALPPIDDYTLSTIIKGLQARDAAITNIEGFGKFITIYSPEEMDFERDNGDSRCF